MRITAKFNLNIFFSVSMIILIGITEFIAFKHSNSVFQKIAEVDQIVINAFELNLLTYEYLMEHSERVYIQWYLRHDNLSELIENIKFNTIEEQHLLNGIKRSHRNMKALFPMLVKNYDKQYDENDKTQWSQELHERFASQLLVKSQNIITGAEHLNRICRKQVIKAQWQSNFIILATVIFIMLVIALNSSLIRKTIVKPIAKLCQDAEIIGKGNLHHSIAVNTDDEIGELSRVFDRMMQNLAMITVSRNKLTMEVKERKLTEEKLRKTTNELIWANEQLQEEIEAHAMAKQQVQKVKNYLDNIINSMPSVLIGIDADEHVTHWNLEAKKVSGIDTVQACGQTIEKVFPQLAVHMDQIRQTIEKREPYKSEKVMTLINGKICYSDIMVYPLISNGVEGAVLRVDDVTARAKLEEMMVQTEKMMSVGGLAAGMAHEINNPLSGILQSAQNTLRRVSPDFKKNIKTAEECGIDMEKLYAYMEKRGILTFMESIREAGERAAKIVDNMLQFSRGSESRMAPAKLDALIDKTVELASSDYDLKKKYDFRHIKIIRDFDSSLPKITCVITEIEQVILNLLKNAAQAMTGMNSNGKRPQITLRTCMDGNEVRIEVEDNGPGMDENVRKRVFEPFFTTKDVGLGTGLGLSVSYFIITKNHQGKMRVESSQDKGAKFIIQLPLESKMT